MDILNVAVVLNNGTSATFPWKWKMWVFMLSLFNHIPFAGLIFLNRIKSINYRFWYDPGNSPPVYLIKFKFAQRNKLFYYTTEAAN